MRTVICFFIVAVLQYVEELIPKQPDFLWLAVFMITIFSFVAVIQDFAELGRK